MIAATGTSTFDHAFSGKLSHAPQWSSIPPEGRPAKDQLLCSIFNLAHAHFIHGERDFSKPVAQTIHSLLLMHASKARLHYLVALPGASQFCTLPLAQQIVSAVWEHEESDLHKKTVDLLQKDVIGQQPPFSYKHGPELASLLTTPDTTPIINLLAAIRAESQSPLVHKPIDTLLSLNWAEVFNTLVKHGFSPLQNSSWGTAWTLF